LNVGVPKEKLVKTSHLLSVVKPTENWKWQMGQECFSIILWMSGRFFTGDWSTLCSCTKTWQWCPIIWRGWNTIGSKNITARYWL